MIILPAQRSVVLHVPRTGGSSFAIACESQVPGARYIRGDLQHAGIRHARRHYPGYATYVVMRSPWEIVESLYGLCRRLADRSELEHWTEHGAGDAHHHLTSWAGRPFDQWVDHVVDDDRLWLKPHTCLHEKFTDEQTVVLHYYESAYEQLQYLLGIDLELPHINESYHPQPVTWSEPSIERVRHYCLGDVVRYGYRAPLKRPKITA